MSKHSRRQVRALRERDGDDCWLCESPIDFGIASQLDPGFGTRDHVNPKADGGSDDLANLRLAHRSCNEARGREMDIRKRSRRRRSAGARRPDIAWDDRMSARPPSGGRVLYLGEQAKSACM
jgi:5-methylcytosine-specific restriction endonuclease McrA